MGISADGVLFYGTVLPETLQNKFEEMRKNSAYLHDWEEFYAANVLGMSPEADFTSMREATHNATICEIKSVVYYDESTYVVSVRDLTATCWWGDVKDVDKIIREGPDASEYDDAIYQFVSDMFDEWGGSLNIGWKLTSIFSH